MLLGQSSKALDAEVALDAVAGRAPAGVANDAELAAFAESAWRGDDTLDGARDRLRAAVGEAGLVEAAQTVAIFRSLNIAADSSGIPLDAEWMPLARSFAFDLGMDRWTTAANTPTL